MRLLLFLFLLTDFKAHAQNKTVISKNGWLVYKHGDFLAFFPIKDQIKTPTYKNFLTEEKGDGERMNNSYSAKEKFNLFKKVKIGLYNYDTILRRDTFMGKFNFYIQPVKYVYEMNNITANTTAIENAAGGWKFFVNRKKTMHIIYYFFDRSGDIYFLNQRDSIMAQKGTRKPIAIYPPH